MIRFYLVIIFCAVVILLVSGDSAFAYLDPGTGSYIIQLIIAAVLGSLFAIKIFWRNIVAFFKKIFSKGKKNE